MPDLTGWDDDQLREARGAYTAAVRNAARSVGDVSVELFCRRVIDRFPDAAYVEFSTVDYDGGRTLEVNDILNPDGEPARPAENGTDYYNAIEEFRTSGEIADEYLGDLSDWHGTDLRETAGVRVHDRTVIDCSEMRLAARGAMSPAVGL